MSKKTLLLGASENPNRYSNRALIQLRAHGHEVVAIGRRAGQVADVPIQASQPALQNIDTVTLYLNQQNQKEYEDYILSLKPRRIIFNPGAENNQLAQKAKESGIEALEACTLVMLSTGQY